jgi:hypothetical protein
MAMVGEEGCGECHPKQRRAVGDSEAAASSGGRQAGWVAREMRAHAEGEQCDGRRGRSEVQRSVGYGEAERRRAKEEGRSGRTLLRFCGWAAHGCDWTGAVAR